MRSPQALLLKNINVLNTSTPLDTNNTSSGIVTKHFNNYIYVLGAFNGTLDIGGGISPITNGLIGLQNGFIAKYTSNFKPLALVKVNIDENVNSEINAASLTISSDGSIYVSGNFKYTLDIGGNVVPVTNTSTIGTGFIAKYSSNLTPLALIGYSNSSVNYFSGISYITTSTNGDIYVSGCFIGKLDIGGGAVPVTNTSKLGTGFIAKYSSNLTPLALIGYSNSSVNDNSCIICITISTNGDIYVSGTFQGKLDIGGTVPPITFKSSGFIAKYDSNFTPLILIESISVLSMKISLTGELYTVGYNGESVTSFISYIFRYTSNLILISNTYVTNKTPKTSSLLWDLEISVDGSIYVHGGFIGTINIGGNVPSITDNVNIFGSGFIARYSSNLEPISLNILFGQVYVPSSANINDTSYASFIVSMVLTQSGELYISFAYDNIIDIGNSVPAISTKDSYFKSFLAKYITNIEPICLVADTPISTDQGIVAIQNIDTAFHTIGSKPIVAITKAITPERHLICFEQHAMGINLPNKRTIMTPGHEVFYKGKLVQAKHFVGKIDGVHTVPYDGKVVYNVLLEKHGLMVVNNMTVETLHPENKVAKMILGSL